MAKFTQEMKDIAAKGGIFIMATADENGKPNGVPMGLARIISDDEILIVDNYMQKTRRNIEINPWVAVSFWGGGVRYGYQVKGRARVETSGQNFEDTIRWMEAKKVPAHIRPKAVVIVKIEEIYYIGGEKDSTIRVDQQAG